MTNTFTYATVLYVSINTKMEKATNTSVLERSSPRESKETAFHMPSNEEFGVLIARDLSLVVPEVVEPFRGNYSEHINSALVVVEVPTTGPLNSAQKQAIRDQFINETTERLSGHAWWSKTEELLVSRYGEDPQKAHDALKLRTAHKFNVITKEGVQGRYEVMECGDTEESKLSEEEKIAIIETLRIIDQFSGGSLTDHPEASRIITVHSKMPHPNDPDQEVSGIALRYGTILNLREIRRLATAEGVEVGTMLGVVLVHEVLGHQLERQSSEGIGNTFQEYFDYSKARMSGNMFDGIHEQITPKDPANAQSRPVREYGFVSPAEDFATTADAMVSDAVGWAKDIEHVERSASVNDPYRAEIVLKVMDQVARAMHEKHGVGVGYVGSPIEYQEGASGLEVVPGRTLIHSEVPIETVIQDQVSRLIQRFKRLTKIVYTDQDPLIF